ncbi:hypothetical protein [Enterococcus sp. DIV0187]|uniref:hypothetical protein n=1 Tax=Enterococcus sp. DIV0187 TaxID=2774644 RepID=UPI003F68327E
MTGIVLYLLLGILLTGSANDLSDFRKVGWVLLTALAGGYLLGSVMTGVLLFTRWIK